MKMSEAMKSLREFYTNHDIKVQCDYWYMPVLGANKEPSANYGIYVCPRSNLDPSFYITHQDLATAVNLAIDRKPNGLALLTDSCVDVNQGE